MWGSPSGSRTRFPAGPAGRKPGRRVEALALQEFHLPRNEIQRRQCWSKFPSRSQARSRGPEHRVRVRIEIEQQPDKTVTHLVPVLRPPNNFLLRVRIELVVGGIVEVRDANQPCSFGERNGFFKVVAQLPIEIEFAIK